MIVEHDGFADRRIELLNDISTVTGATIVDSRSKVRGYANVLGFCDEVIANQQFTSILGGRANPDQLNKAIESMTAKINSGALSLNDLKFYMKRLANLHGGVAVIHVGGATRVEVDEVYARVEDAVLAIKATMRSGVVPGGAYVWEKIAHKRSFEKVDDDSSRARVRDAIFNALNYIFFTLLDNAGLSDEISQYREDIREAIS